MSSKDVVDGVCLFNRSPHHQIYTLVEFDSYFMAPLQYNKARIFYDGDVVVGFAAWGHLSPEDGELLLDEKIHPNDSHYSGELQDNRELWVLEFVAPFGHAGHIARALRQDLREIYGQGMEVHWRKYPKFYRKITRRL